MELNKTENIWIHTESQPETGQDRVFRSQEFKQLSDLRELYDFSANGYYATRKWCRENAKLIRLLQSYPDLYMHGGRFWEYPFVFKLLMERPESRIIDIGIGEGVFASILAKHGHQVIGVDNYASCWRDLNNTLVKTGIPSVNADARNLGMFKDEQFDIALLISVIEHIPSNTIWCENRKITKTGDLLREEVPQKLRAISETLRVVKPGGLVIITSDIYLDYPPDMNISWKELLGVKGIDREVFNDLNEIYLNDNPIHKGRELSVAIVIEKHGNSAANNPTSAIETASGPFLERKGGKASNTVGTGELIRKGERHFTRGEYDQAKTCFQHALSQKPNHTEVLNNLGVIAFTEGALEEAETLFLSALQIDQTYSEALENLAKCAEAKKSPLESETHNRRIGNAVEVIKKDPLKIGFISVWYERGQAYVTKAIRDALAKDHHTFVLARTGAVYPDQPHLETTGFWEVQNLLTFPFYNIPPESAKDWINENHLDIVVFNEEYDWQLVEKCKATGVKIVTYLDHYKEEWKPYLELYDAVICSTKRSFDLVKNDCNAHYTGWGIDTDLYRPSDESIEKHTFFHNAGWLGINYRKMTPAVISAFDSISRDLEGETLFIHSQAPLHQLPAESIQIIENNPRITFHVETVPAPGLYAEGEIHVFPSKLEGLGLPLLEGLSFGLPTITTDAPPMNEFVTNGYNGLLVNVGEIKTRDDNIAFPETIVDLKDLAHKLKILAQNSNLKTLMGKNARESAENEFSFASFRSRLGEVFDALARTVSRS